MTTDQAEPRPFLVRDGAVYMPTEISRGYWTPNNLNGRVVVGLLGHELEAAFGEPDFQPARLTVDMFRTPQIAPLRVETRLVRGGGRIKVGDADIYCADVLIGRASALFLRRSMNPENPTWQPPNWKAPKPETLPSLSRPRSWEVRQIPANASTYPREAGGASAGASSNPSVLGDLTPFPSRQAWMRDIRELIGGTPLTPFVRVALAADYASPLTNSSEHSIDFINGDVTLYIHRLPVTEWIGFELVNHHAADGVAVGEAWIHDEAGALGTANVAAIAQARR